GFTETDGDRPDVEDVVVVFTDGRSSYPDKTNESAWNLKKKGVHIIAIGVVENLENDEKKSKIEEELKNIASSPKDVKMIDFANLETLIGEIAYKVCENSTTPTPPKKTTTLPPSTTLAPSPALITTVTPSPTLPLTTTSPSTTIPRSTTLTPSTSVPPTPPTNCSGKDVLFVVDGTVNSRQSYDLAQEDFENIKGFIKSVIRGLNDTFRVGVMQYTDKDTARMEIDFMSPLEFSDTVKDITITQQRGYKRYTGDALAEAANRFYEHDYLQYRENNPDVIVLVTRGTPNGREQALSKVKILESRKIDLVTVGVHSGASAPGYLKDFLLNMTQPPLMFLSNYKDLEKNREPVLQAIRFPLLCAPAPTPPPVICNGSRHDIFFVVDGSASINSHNFDKVKNFLSHLITQLSVESSAINTGLMQFSKEDLTTVEWDLGRYSEIETKNNALKLNYQAGTRTEAGDALTHVINE
ncbi:von Willebrand factor, partial [Paramuricea clavata]